MQTILQFLDHLFDMVMIGVEFSDIIAGFIFTEIKERVVGIPK
jgi:hypothetical protein